METECAIFVESSMNRRLAFLGLIVVIPVALFAHHGTGGTYDMEKPITLKGAVTEFKFVNPHVLVSFNVADKNGSLVNWVASGPSVINWTRAGWNRNSIKAKDEVTVTLFPARSGKPKGVVRKIVSANGKQWCC